jgi:hypothetical protein
LQGPTAAVQAALLPKVTVVFPMEPGAKKGTTIQEQAITTAVLGGFHTVSLQIPFIG